LIKDEKSLNEKQLIEEFFSDVGSAYLADRDIIIGVGDDAAVIKNLKNRYSVLSIDTALVGVHFFNDMDPSDIAYRSVSISLSDILACGAEPSWFILSLTLEQTSKEWLRKFRSGLEDISSEFCIPLIGGDITKGPLSITVQAGGYSSSSEIIKRSTANNEDLIFVTGSIGKSFQSLSNYKKGEGETSSYIRPSLRKGVALKLNGLASSAIDISDGLFQDLNQICKLSKKGAEVYLENVPHPFKGEFDLSLLNKGDDYEICFTAPSECKAELKKISEEENVRISEIGKITDFKEVRFFNKKEEVFVDLDGYQHF
tara:strand:- start:38 stop:979 length:942 start_codon:yes stop_codon:yes gene_type:complete